MFTFKHGLPLGVVLGFVIYFMLFSPIDRSIPDVKRVVSTPLGQQRTEATKHVDCPQDLETQKMKMAEIYMHNQTEDDDPGLINFMRKYILEDPDPYGKLTLSIGIKKTTQAGKVLQLLKNKKGGFFVEAGAFDGETSSNTIYLEQAMNWTGLLIEMDPGLFLQTKGKYRGSVIANACLSAIAHPAKAQIIRNPRHHQATKVTLDSEQKVSRKYQALCFPFYSFMLAMGKTEIDYFSLDVEGLEMEVLKTIPFDKLNIKVLTIEYMHSKHDKKAFNRIMKRKGYKMYADLTKCNVFCKDLVFVNRDLLD